MEFGPSASCFIFSVFILVAFIHLSIADEVKNNPTIISRKEWGAKSPVKTATQRVPVPFIVIHHGGMTEYCFNITTCSILTREYQELHMVTRGWDDIGYSFMVGEDGNVYEGRGWHRVGAHAPQYNNQSIGISIIGDFADRLPNTKALEAVKALIQMGIRDGLIIENYTMLGHRQARDTKCPGEELYKEIKTWPNWDPHPSPRKYCTTCASSDSVSLYSHYFVLTLFILSFVSYCVE